MPVFFHLVPPGTVPDVYNMTQANAESAITAASLTVGTVDTDYNETIAAGNVYDQDPAAGTRVAYNTPVNLDVSLGPAEVEITAKTLAGADDGYIFYAGNPANTGTEVPVGNNYPCGYFCFYPSIPQGATINSATVDFVTQTAGWATCDDLYIRFLNEDNHPQPIDGSSASKTAFQNASKTSAITWAIPNPSVNGTARTTPELKTILQTVISRAGWSPGNRLILYLGGPAGDVYTNEFTGPVGVTFRPYEAGGGNIPELNVNYSA